MMRTLTPILSLIIAVLLFIFFLKPQYAAIQDLQLEVDAYNEATMEYAEFTKAIEEKLQVIDERPVTDTVRLNKLVPEDVDDAQVLVSIESIVKKHKMLFGNVKIDTGEAVFGKASANAKNAKKVEVSSELRRVDLSFGVIGTYEQMKSVLKELESSLTLFDVVKIMLVTSPGKFQQFDITVRTYALPKK